MRGIIEQCNQALVMLMLPDPERELLEQTRSALYQCKLDLASEGLRGITAAFGPLEQFRERTEGLQRLRWQCASTLLGEPVPGGPPTGTVAKQWLSDSRGEAKAIVGDLARELRLYGLSIEGFVVY